MTTRRLISIALLAAGCGSSGPVGGPIDAGKADEHCRTANDGGPLLVTVDPAACRPDAGPPVDGAVEETTDYAPTMYNQEGDDDDCKYHVVFTATPVKKGEGVTF